MTEAIRNALLILMVVVIELCVMTWYVTADDEDDFNPYHDIEDWKLRP